jgi:ATP-dependent DNA helicase RecQ
VIALTATADKVTRRDILAQMGIPEENVFISSFDRPNLSLTVLPGRNRTKIIADFINKRPQQPGIIYCLARNTTESVADSLRKMGIKAKHYHAKMDYEYRKQVQEEFIKDEIQVIVATIAFGMGIDKPNVRWIIHYNLPNNVESFYQEIGRAGRDGLKSDTLLFYSFADVISRQRMLEDSELSPEMRELQEAKLDRMKQYAEAEICRRRILLSYFNETVTQDCGNCDVCRNPPKRFDGTVIAQKALSGIARTGEQVAMGMLIDILRGSLNKSIVGKGYEKLKTFGVGKDIRGEEWADYLIQMLNSGVIDIAHDEKHSFKLNETSWQVLKQNRAVHLVNFVPYEARKARQAEEFVPEKSKKQVLSEKMFDALRQLRKQVADQQDVPAFVVFSDTTLKDMAEKMPATIAQMSRVSGVGDAKLKQYGQIFVNEIVKFIRENTETGKTRVVKGFTYIETLEMFREGLSVVEIAHHKGVTPQTIVGHLVKLAEEGETFEWQRAIPTADYKAIRQAAQKLGINKGDALKPLFEALNERFDYNILRLAMWVE